MESILEKRNYKPVPQDMVQTIFDEMEEGIPSESGKFVTIGGRRSEFNSYEEYRENLLGKARSKGLGFDVMGDPGLNRELLENCKNAGIEYELKDKDQNELEGCELADYILSRLVKPEGFLIEARELEEVGEESNFFMSEDEQLIPESEGMVLQYGPEETMKHPCSEVEFSTPEFIIYSNMEEGVYVMGGPLMESSDLINQEDSSDYRDLAFRV